MSYSDFSGKINLPGLMNTSFRYYFELSPFALTVLVTEYIIALVCTPFTDVENSQFFLLITNDLPFFLQDYCLLVYRDFQKMRTNIKFIPP